MKGKRAEMKADMDAKKEALKEKYGTDTASYNAELAKLKEAKMAEIDAMKAEKAARVEEMKAEKAAEMEEIKGDKDKLEAKKKLRLLN